MIGTKRLYGMDIDEYGVEQAREKGIEAIKHDANAKFPHEDDSFDVVVSNQVLEHLWNTDGFFSEIRRILDPGGYAVISTANLSSFHNLAFMGLGMMPPGPHVSRVQVVIFFMEPKPTVTLSYSRLRRLETSQDIMDLKWKSSWVAGFTLSPAGFRISFHGYSPGIPPTLLSRWGRLADAHPDGFGLSHLFLLGGEETRMYEVARRLAEKTMNSNHIRTKHPLKNCSI
ncbi:MAG: class I SAM-dependent methyltransferase [Candidatus Hodarchaeaceae archaeon]|nr:class I SAM-dependent methyltransferase [Candidatus Hodarchaeaceae archaeon]